MSSANQDDLQYLYGHGHGEALRLTSSDVAAWQTDESSFSPSKASEPSFVALIPSASDFNQKYPWSPEDDYDAREDSVGDELPFLDPLLNVSYRVCLTTLLARCITTLLRLGLRKPGRERNRIAAQKCRQKSKHYIEELQQQERELAQENSFLTAHAGHLKNEVLYLRNEILNHGTCDCELIQNYIAETAKKL